MPTPHISARTRTHVHTQPPTHSVTLTNCDSSLPMLAFPFHFHHAKTLLPNAIDTPLTFAGSGTGRQEQILSFMNSATENRTHRSMIATCALCQLLGIHETGKRSTAVDQEKREAGLCTQHVLLGGVGNLSQRLVATHCKCLPNMYKVLSSSPSTSDDYIDK